MGVTVEVSLGVGEEVIVGSMVGLSVGVDDGIGVLVWVGVGTGVDNGRLHEDKPDSKLTNKKMHIALE